MSNNETEPLNQIPISNIGSNLETNIDSHINSRIDKSASKL